MSEKNQLIVDQIRSKLSLEFDRNGSDFHRNDIEMVTTNDWPIERFVIEYTTEEKAFEALIKTLKWKKSFGIHDRTDHYFPKEFYEVFERERFGRDREGRLIQWESQRNDQKISGFQDLYKQFLAHMVDRVDAQAGRHGFTLVSDISGGGLSSVNMEFLKFRIELFAYYPQGLRRVIVVDLPVVLQALTKVVTSWVPKHISDRLRFVRRHELHQFVDIDAIPVRLGGRRQTMGFPSDLKTMDQLNGLSLSDKQIEKYYKIHKKDENDK